MLIAFIYNFTQMYFIANLILRIHGEKASVLQKAQFAFLTGVVIYTLFIYVIYYFGGMLSFQPLTYLLVVTPNPITALLYCYLGIKVLKLSPIRSIELMGNAYLYYSITISITRLVGSIFFIQTSERYNYLLDATRNMASFIAFFTMYGITCYVLNKKSTTLIPKTNVFVNRKKELTYFVIRAFIVYLCSVCIPMLIPETVVANVVILVFLCMLFFITILLSNNFHANADNRNKDAHINSLIRTLEEFRAVKHDFYNILQTYNGYFTIGDLEACKKYHAKLVDVTMMVGEPLNLSEKMPENPALVSLLIDKHTKAVRSNVTMDIAIKCDLSGLPMDEIDICRVLSCLIDNAIEAAEASERRRVFFSMEQKTDDSKLFIITNSILRQPDMAQIFAEGVTDKAGHHGVGLTNVRRIIDKYGNCTFQLNCYNNEMTAYVELKNG